MNFGMFHKLIFVLAFGVVASTGCHDPFEDCGCSDERLAIENGEYELGPHKEDFPERMKNVKIEVTDGEVTIVYEDENQEEVIVIYNVESTADEYRLGEATSTSL